jgi:hypothetical protein
MNLIFYCQKNGLQEAIFLWCGVGYGEEVILLAKILTMMEFQFKIYCIELK